MGAAAVRLWYEIVDGTVECGCFVVCCPFLLRVLEAWIMMS